MDPRAFHTLAQRLSPGPAAADCRTAVSRAYYATFNVGAEILRGLGFRVRKGAAAHGEIYHCLSNGGDPAVVTKIVATAGAVIRVLDEAFASPRRLQLQPAIARWRRENGYP